MRLTEPNLFVSGIAGEFVERDVVYFKLAFDRERQFEFL